MPGLAEWQFTESAEVQLHEAPSNAGHSVLTLGVILRAFLYTVTILHQSCVLLIAVRLLSLSAS